MNMMHDKKKCSPLSRFFLEVSVVLLTILRADIALLIPTSHRSKPSEHAEDAMVLFSLQVRLLQ